MYSALQPKTDFSFRNGSLPVADLEGVKGFARFFCRSNITSDKADADGISRKWVAYPYSLGLMF